MPVVLWPGCFSAVTVVGDENGGFLFWENRKDHQLQFLACSWVVWPKGLCTDSTHSVTLVVLVGLAIVSVPTWIYVNNFGAHPSEPSVANKTDQLQ